jgi:hypothetical protein
VPLSTLLIQQGDTFCQNLHCLSNEVTLCASAMHVKFTLKIVLGKNLEILLLLNPGTDRSVTAVKVSNTS